MIDPKEQKVKMVKEQPCYKCMNRNGSKQSYPCKDCEENAFVNFTSKYV